MAAQPPFRAILEVQALLQFQEGLGLKIRKRLCIFLIYVLLLLNSACLFSPPQPAIVINMWHNYFGGGSMQSRMDQLIDEFNRSEGRKQGIILNVSLIGTSSDLVKNFDAILKNEPGASEMPTIAIVYPRTALALQEQGLLLSLDEHFTAEELAAFKPDFLEEGKIANTLCVLPANKSTEVIFLNQTHFDQVADAIEAEDADLTQIETLFTLAKRYYAYTDEQTPDIPSDGRDFLAIDSWYNFFQIYMSQKGSDFLGENGKINATDPHFLSLWNDIADLALIGGLTTYNGYASEISRTGDCLCSIGSTAGILYYGNEVTFPDGHTEEVDYTILPFPISEGGEAFAIQRGGGLIVTRSSAEVEAAAVAFLKWFTEAQRNYQFTLDSGYMPVKNESYDSFVKQFAENEEKEVMDQLQETLAYMSANYRLEFTPLLEQDHDLNERFDDVMKEQLIEARASLATDERNYEQLKADLLSEIISGLEP